MSEAKITLIGFNNFMQAMDDDLFKYLNLPNGIDKDMLTNNILMKGGEFEVLYADPVFMQRSIQVWSHKWYNTFEKWVEALSIKYAPLDNYNRYEEYEDIHAGSGSVGTTNTLKATTTDKSSSEHENTVSAYDSDDYQPKEKNETEYDDKVISDNTGNSNTVTSDKKNIKHNAHLWGNIGVTTSQQMLRDQLDVVRFNLIDNITDIFLREYAIPIY